MTNGKEKKYPQKLEIGKKKGQLRNSEENAGSLETKRRTQERALSQRM